MISNGFVSSGYSTRIYLVMQAMLISGKSAILITLFVGSISGYTSAFCQNSFFRRIRLNSPNLVLRESTQSNGDKSARYEKNKLLNDFKTSKGEVLNPYRILKVSRTFDKTEVKQAYRKLSKKFHPDMVRNSDIFPGNWLKYNRESALADPAVALGRSAINIMNWGVLGLGQGIYKAGEVAVSQLNKD